MRHAFPVHFLAGRSRWHIAFIGGLGLSAIAIAALFGLAYFAGTAPQVPRSAAALETLQPANDNGVAPVQARPLPDAAAPTRADAAPTNPSAPSHGTAPSQAPPIDISDLPPPEHRAVTSP